MSLVALHHPSLLIDLAYATPDNFTGRVLYNTAEQCTAKMDEIAALALYRAADLAEGLGRRLKVLDAFRPISIQEELWAVRPDPEFVADPAIGSDHSRGTAVDLTLTDLSGGALDMGTAFDEASAESHHGVTTLSQAAQLNRAVLLGIMTAAGFQLNRYEWWHYSLPNSELFPLRER